MSQSAFPSEEKTSFPMLSPGYRLSGYLVLALGLIVSFYGLVIGMGIQLGGDKGKPEPLAVTGSVIVIIGLAVIAASREKQEDELLNFMRLKAMRNAFVLLVAGVILLALLQLFSNMPVVTLSGTRLTIIVLLTYIISFRLYKKQL